VPAILVLCPFGMYYKVLLHLHVTSDQHVSVLGIYANVEYFKKLLGIPVDLAFDTLDLSTYRNGWATRYWEWCLLVSSTIMTAGISTRIM
jgi:hypothetical protein